MKIDVKEKEFASRLRNFIVEFFAVFFIVALNGTFLVLILTTAMSKGLGTSSLALIGIIYLLLGCTISACLIYLVKGRVYYNKIKAVCVAANKVAKGDFNARVPVFFDKPRSEMDYLAVNFNRMLTEISSLENMKNDFVADVSHEIKTPLSVIQGYTDLLQNTNLTKETQSEYIELISEAIHKLSELVSNVLKLNKIENQEFIQREKYFLDEQIRCSILSFEEAIEKKQIQFDVDLQELVINTDKVLLELVWNNLISNAIKFSEQSGKISISLKQKKGKVFFSIKDNGCGIDTETQKYIFNKFYQGDQSHSQNGNGLGLALVKNVVDKLGGEISVKSEPDKGAEFIVVIREC